MESETKSISWPPYAFSMVGYKTCFMFGTELQNIDENTCHPAVLIFNHSIEYDDTSKDDLLDKILEQNNVPEFAIMFRTTNEVDILIDLLQKTKEKFIKTEDSTS